MLFLIIVSLAFFRITSAVVLTPEQYGSNITFYLFNDLTPSNVTISDFDTPMNEQGCDSSGNFAIITHGWREGFETPWVPILVKNLLKYRAGCVLFMDYSNFSVVTSYGSLTPHFNGIAAVLLKKVKQIENFDRLFLFGFSFGSRLCIDAGLKIGTQKIARIDVCDPAGPGFNNALDPKPAAKIVSCISTSSDKGTSFYNCHQNFRMGLCGYSQPAAGSDPLGSHGLCPYFYNLAFTNDFTSNNLNNCYSTRMVVNATDDVKMGYLGNFNRTLYSGDIFIATSKFPPYIVEKKIVDNQLSNLLNFMSKSEEATSNNQTDF